MSFLDILQQAAREPVAAYQQFLIEAGKCSDCVHAFYEGFEDSSFYSGHIVARLALPDLLRTYICGNKRSVYKVYDMVTRSRHTAKALYFVDRDLAIILGEALPTADAIYVTNYYSIENYLVSSQMFAVVWREFFQFYDVTLNQSYYLNRFTQELERFHRLMLPICAWIIYTRRENLRPQLDDLNLNRLFLFDSTVSLRKKTSGAGTQFLSQLESMCNVITPQGITPSLLQVTREIYATGEPKTYLRGKYEIWFFVEYLKKLAEVLQAELTSAGNGRIRYTPTLVIDTTVKILGPRLVPTPSSLTAFLNTNLS